MVGTMTPKNCVLAPCFTCPRPALPFAWPARFIATPSQGQASHATRLQSQHAQLSGQHAVKHVPTKNVTVCRATKQRSAASVNLTAEVPGSNRLLWERVDRWVVFSDLHVTHDTCEVCIEVLRRVHEEAVARDAGILFLGDFWHFKEDLPVRPLNQVTPHQRPGPPHHLLRCK